MSEQKSAETQTLTPEQNFFQVVNKHIGIPSEEDWARNENAIYYANEREHVVPEVTKDGVFEIVRAYKAKLEADAIIHKRNKNPNLAQDLEKHIWDCDMSISALNGQSKNTGPLIRTISNIVALQQEQDQKDYLDRRPLVDDFVLGVVGVALHSDKFQRTLNRIFTARNIRDQKDALADGLLTTTLTRANEWVGASAPK